MSDETEIPEEERAEGTGTDETETASDSGDAMGLEEMVDNSISENEKEDFQPGEPMAKDVEAIYDIPVQISAVLGRSTMQVSQLLKLGRGAVVELDRKVGEAIDIYVNNRLVARGEVVVVEDKLGITMTEIVKSDRN
jgi:flagellar motor switch protein FliN/FliY